MENQEKQVKKEKMKLFQPKEQKEKAPKEKETKAKAQKQAKSLTKKPEGKKPGDKAVSGGKKIKEGKFNKLMAIRVKVTALVLCSIVISSVIVSVLMINYTKGLVIDSTYAKMLNVVNSYGQLVNEPEIANNKKPLKDTEVYRNIFEGLQVDGSESSYCYVINVSGIITYHPDETKIGKPNKNKVITKVVSDLAKGKYPEKYCLEYEEDGKSMYASYYVSAAKSVIIMCADGSELMSPIRKLGINAVIFILVIMAVAYFLADFVTKRFTKPLNEVTEIINDTAKLQLKLPENIDKLCARSDETGVMSRAVRQMSESLHSVVKRIETANSSIETNMKQLEDSSNQVHLFCTDNSATTQELAASTEEVNSMTNLMAAQMDEMRTQFADINKETVESNKASEEIAGRAQNLQASTQQAIQHTREMYEQIKTKSELALQGLQAVARINELTSAIIDISDQTSLLSLNASIEAARAGEAGKGFAVVASEISNLAHRSLDTVNDINAIIEEVNVAVANISNSLEETTTFLEQDVLSDYDNFNQIGDQYLRDADTFKEVMTNISKDTNIVSQAIEEVAEAVERIKDNIEDTSSGINDIAEKTTNVVESTSANYELTEDTVNSVNELKTIVNSFEF